MGQMEKNEPFNLKQLAEPMFQMEQTTKNGFNLPRPKSRGPRSGKKRKRKISAIRSGVQRQCKCIKPEKRTIQFRAVTGRSDANASDDKKWFQSPPASQITPPNAATCAVQQTPNAVDACRATNKGTFIVFFAVR